MTGYLGYSSIVIDANIAVWAVIPTDMSLYAAALLFELRQNDLSLYAPSLWLPESVAAIRRYVHAGRLSTAMSDEAVTGLFELEVQIVETTASRCSRALWWAERLGQSKAYDGFYLALAEEYEALLCTADRRLVTAANDAGVDWVRLLDEGG